MRTVADFKRFILQWLRCREWKDLYERDEYRGGGYLLGHFWHEIHGLGNPDYQRIEEEITESDRNTPLSDSLWNELWVRACRLDERTGSSPAYPELPDEEILRILLATQEKY